MKRRELARYLEATNLFPTTTTRDIISLCESARKDNVAGVCIAPCFISLAKEALHNSNTSVVTVVGFPHGNQTTYNKVAAAHEAILLGASEIDMVMNISLFKSGCRLSAWKDIADVARSVAGSNAQLKVIIETALLTDEEKASACKLVLDAGADYVKTSTGFASSGATVEDIILLKAVAKEDLKIKAAGGIRDYVTAIKMIEAGASRLGCSTPEKLLEGAEVDD